MQKRTAIYVRVKTVVNPTNMYKTVYIQQNSDESVDNINNNVKKKMLSQHRVTRTSLLAESRPRHPTNHYPSKENPKPEIGPRESPGR